MICICICRFRKESVMDVIIDIVLDAVIDSVKILPFLYLTYLAMEYLEHRTAEFTENVVQKTEHFGPLLGGVIGIMMVHPALMNAWTVTPTNQPAVWDLGIFSIAQVGYQGQVIPVILAVLLMSTVCF